MIDFKELLLKAQSGDNQAKEELLEMYRPLLLKESIVNGVFDEDLYQELCIRFICFSYEKTRQIDSKSIIPSHSSEKLGLNNA